MCIILCLFRFCMICVFDFGSRLFDYILRSVLDLFTFVRFPERRGEISDHSFYTFDLNLVQAVQ